MCRTRRWCVSVTALGLVAGSAACAHGRTASSGAALSGAASARAPASVLGRFVDDYEGRYEISTTHWRHGTRLVYEIESWHADSQYVIARNASTNPRDAGTWVRIDWMPLTGMPPYAWAYCLSAYNAPTRDEARASRTANRAAPRTGCNGFPFSRMRAVPSSPDNTPSATSTAGVS